MKCYSIRQDIEFDLVGVDASIANALRRIMLAEVTLSLVFEHITDRTKCLKLCRSVVKLVAT